MDVPKCKKGHPMKLYKTWNKRTLKDGTIKKYAKEQWRCRRCDHKKYYKKVKRKKKKQSTVSRFCERHKITKKTRIQRRLYTSKQTGKEYTITTKVYVCLQCQNERYRNKDKLSAY